jgi:hypothetical protein
MKSIGDKTLRQVGEDLLEHPLLEAFSQFLGVVLALQSQLVQKGQGLDPPFALDLDRDKGMGAEQQPEIAESRGQIQGLRIDLGQDLFQIDLIIIGGPRVGALTVETPEFAIGHHHPGSLALFEQADDHGAGVFTRGFVVPFVVLAVQQAPPGIDQAKRQRVRPSVFRCMEAIGRFGRTVP